MVLLKPSMDDLAKQFWADAIRYHFQRNVLRGVKISRQIFMLPIILSVGFVIGVIVGRIWNPGGTSLSSDDLSEYALAFYLVFGGLAFIPFWVVAGTAKRSISNDEYKIYQIRGSLVGLSLLTLSYFFVIGVVAALAPDEKGTGAVHAAALLAYLAVIIGIAVALFGWLVGFLYGRLQINARPVGLIGTKKFMLVELFVGSTSVLAAA